MKEQLRTKTERERERERERDRESERERERGREHCDLISTRYTAKRMADSHRLLSLSLCAPLALPERASELVYTKEFLPCSTEIPPVIGQQSRHLFD